MESIKKTARVHRFALIHPWTHTLSCRIQTPGLLLGLVMEFPPLFFTKPWVFSFSHPWLLSCPWFSLFPTLGCYSALGFPLFPSLVTIQPLVFHFYLPLAIIPPLAFIQQVRVALLRITFTI